MTNDKRRRSHQVSLMFHMSLGICDTNLRAEEDFNADMKPRKGSPMLENMHLSTDIGGAISEWDDMTTPIRSVVLKLIHGLDQSTRAQITITCQTAAILFELEVH